MLLKKIFFRKGYFKMFGIFNFKGIFIDHLGKINNISRNSIF